MEVDLVWKVHNLVKNLSFVRLPSLEYIPNNCQIPKKSSDGDISRVTKLLELMHILHIRYGYHKFIQGIGPMSNLLTVKEVNYESV